MQKIIKFIMENKLFILQLTFLGIIAMNQTAFASDFAMNCYCFSRFYHRYGGITDYRKNI